VENGQDNGQWTLAIYQWAVNFKYWTVGSGQWTVMCRQWAVDSRHSQCMADCATKSCIVTLNDRLRAVQFLLCYSADFCLSLTSYNRDFLEKLTVPQRVRKFPMFYGIRMFINFFARSRHRSVY
jgi:hypothetical protein